MEASAQDILESTTWKEVSDKLRQDLVDEFERASPDDPKALQSVSYRRGALDEITRELTRRLQAPSINLKR